MWMMYCVDRTCFIGTYFRLHSGCSNLLLLQISALLEPRKIMDKEFMVNEFRTKEQHIEKNEDCDLD